MHAFPLTNFPTKTKPPFLIFKIENNFFLTPGVTFHSNLQIHCLSNMSLLTKVSYNYTIYI